MTTEPEDDSALLRAVERCSLALALLLALGGGYVSGWRFACSALLGSALSGGSFFVLKQTVRGIVGRIGTQRPAAGFAIRFYLRLLALALLLAVLSMSIHIHLIGLAAGLSTVMVSVVAVALARGWTEFSGKHARGA